MKEHVKIFLDNVLNELKEVNHIAAIINYSGSHLHGTAHDKSDYDFYGIYYPSIESLIKKEDTSELVFKTSTTVNTEIDIDLKLISIYDFFNRLEKGDLNAIDFLFSLTNDKNTVVLNDKYLKDFLVENQKELFVPNYYAMIGYAMKQVSTYSEKGIKYKDLDKIIDLLNNEPKKSILKNVLEKEGFKNLLSNTKHIKLTVKNDREYLSIVDHLFDLTFKVEYILKETIKIKDSYGSRVKKNDSGIDYKAYSHAIRSFIEAKTLIYHGSLYFPLDLFNCNFLKDIKMGKINADLLDPLISDYNAEINNYMKINESAIKNANRKIDKSILNNLLDNIYLKKNL